MEVNEMNAQRVNDVYSELAAITAADTQEIGTAMSKTASIANSANMEFETTAAFLSQIIETTREAPETAGTAMKTIIARFTEMKKLYTEEQLTTGVDAEGEAFDINKIDTALKSVGMSLQGFMTGAEGIDDVLLELASKWDTLDIATQRYIATQAAGSRQQSRFLAMMGDYDRTMELVDAAYNSTGSSQEQFEKTLDSMESKLNELKNAWDTFAMGLANNSLLKGAIDGLTGLLSGINTVLSGIGKISPVLQSLTSIFLSFLALKGGKRLFDKAFSWIGDIKQATSSKVIQSNTTLGITSGAQAASGAVQEMFRKAAENGTRAGVSGNSATGGILGPDGKPINKNDNFNNNNNNNLNSNSNSLTGKIGGLFGKLGSKISNSKFGKNFSAGLEKSGGISSIFRTFTIAATIIDTGTQITEKLIKTQTELADDFKKTSESVKEYNTKLNTTLDGLNEQETNLKTYQKTLKSVDKGSKEYNTTLKENNSTATELINSEIGKQVIADNPESYQIEEGIYKLSSQFFDKYNEIAEQQIKINDFYISAAEAAQTSLENSANLTANLTTSAITDEEQSNILTAGGITGGIGAGIGFGVSTAAAGAATGATAGSVVPGLGTAIGAIIGLIIGTITALAVSSYGPSQSTMEGSLETLAKNGVQFTDEQFDTIKERGSYEYLAVSDSESDQQLYANLQLVDSIYGVGTAMDLLQQSSIDSANALNEIINTAGANEINNDNATYKAAYDYYTQKYPDEKFEQIEERADKLVNDLGFELNPEKIEKRKKIDWDNADEETKAKVLNELGIEKTGTNTYRKDGEKLEKDEIESYIDQAQTNLTTELIFDEADKISNGVEFKIDFDKIADFNSKKIEGESLEEQRAFVNELPQRLGTLSTAAHRGIDVSDDLQQIYNKAIEIFGEEGVKALEIDKDSFSDASASNLDKLVDAFTNLNVRWENLAQGNQLSNITYDSDNGLQQKEGFESLSRKEQLALVGTIIPEDSELDPEEVFEKLYGDEASIKKAYEDLLSINVNGDEIAKIIANNSSIDTATKYLGWKEDFGTLGQDVTTGLASIIEEVNNLNPSKQKEFYTALENLDETDPESVEEFTNAITELGIDVEEVDVLTLGENIRILGGIFSEVAGTTASDIKTIRGILNELDYGKEYSEEDITSFRKEGVDIDKYFGKNGESYVLKTGVLDEVKGILEQNTTGQIVEPDFKESLNKGEKWEKSKNWGVLGQTSNFTFDSKEYTNGQDFLNAFATSENSNIEPEILDQVVRELKARGYTDALQDFLNEDGSWKGGQQSAQNFVQNALKDSTNYEANLASQETYAYGATSTDQLTTVDSNLRNEAANNVLSNVADAEGLDATELLAVKDALQQVNSELSDFDAAQVAEDYVKMSKGADKWTESIEDYEKQLEDVTIDETKRNTIIKELSKVGAQALSIDEDTANVLFSQKKNRDLLTQAIGGNTKALSKLRYEAGKAKFEEIIDGGELSDSIDEALQMIANANLDAGEVIDSNDELATAVYDMFDAAAASAIAGGATVEEAINQANGVIENLGIEAPKTDGFETVYETVSGITSPGEEPYLTGSITIGAGQTVPGYKYRVVPGEEYSYQVPHLVPKADRSTSLTAKGTNFGGGGHRSSGGGGGGGGSSKSEDTKTWKNPFDKYYNTVEKINELLRERNKLESNYDKLLTRNSTTLKDVEKNISKQLKNLREEAKEQQYLANGRLDQLRSTKNATYEVKEGRKISYQQAFNEAGGSGDLSSYIRYDEEKGQRVIDWDRINGIVEEEQGKVLEAYESELAEREDSYEEAIDKLDDIESAITEIIDKQLEERVNYIQTIRDMLVDSYQRQIDKLSDLNETISNANQNILNGIQESIDLERQIRDNTDTEKDISDKEARLAYLRRDTSGANDLEIKQLEEELGDMRQDYSDTLVDQAVDRLSKQNEKAQEAREQQIDIMQSQLDWWSKSGYFNKTIAAMNESELKELFKSYNDWFGQTESEKISLLKEFNQLYLAGNSGNKELAAADSLYGEKRDYTLTDAKGNTFKVHFNSTTGMWENEKGTIKLSSDDISSANIVKNTLKTNKDFTPAQENKNSQDKDKKGKNYAVPSEFNEIIRQGASGWKVQTIQWALNSLGFGNSGTSGVDGKYGSGTARAIRNFQKAMGISADGIFGPKTAAAFKTKGYKTGGLANYTGPAWLDGTPSKPELVLNARDTQNFIVLKDVLADLVKNGSTKQEKFGDNYYDFHINVEQMANDYDVEKMIQKVKDEINKDSTYRNVNSINFMR